MNWKLIFQLSIFGLIMAFGTVTLIPQDVEPVFWIIIFIFSSFVIARACTARYFLHGFLTGLVNCVWVSAVHVFFYDRYIAVHKQVDMLSSGNTPASLATHPRVAMAIVGLVLGIVAAIISGLFALVASKITRRTK